MKFIIFISVFFMVISCKKQVSEPLKIPTTKSSFQVYQMSEMSLLMEQMYVDNKHIRDLILSGEVVEGDSLPAYYSKLKMAVLTDPTDRDLFFTTHMEQFLKAQQLVYEVKVDKKENFNSMVRACISCHEVKCGGPIERIKKLLIP